MICRFEDLDSAGVEKALTDALATIQPGTWLDVRLQVLECGAWKLHTGDPSYDSSLEGYWGCASIRHGMEASVSEVAEDLLTQAVDDWYVKNS